MINIFDYNDYRVYIQHWVINQPNQGHGVYTRLSEYLGTQRSVISQVIKRKRDLSMDQAHSCAKFLGLSENSLSWEYFLNLVSIEKAACYKYKQALITKKKQLHGKHLQVSTRVLDRKRLTPEESQQYYSDLDISLTRTFLAIYEDLGKTFESLKPMGMTHCRFTEIIGILESLDLINIKKGQAKITSTKIHIDKTSLYFKNFKANLKSLSNSFVVQGLYPEDSLDYQGLLSLSEETALKIRDMLLNEINTYSEMIKDSKSEQAYFCNFEFRRLT